MNQGISLETVLAIVPKKKPSSSVKKLGRPPLANPSAATLRKRRSRAQKQLKAQELLAVQEQPAEQQGELKQLLNQDISSETMHSILKKKLGRPVANP